MKSIEKETEHTIIVQKSKFICLFIPLHSVDDVTFYINRSKTDYPNATHYCYAYICEGHRKCSDDGEPSGTAGMPILNVLEKNQLDHILCIVVRYFGGIKLGAGGLVRAYTRSVTECLSYVTMVSLIKGYEIELTYPYDLTKTIQSMLKEYKVIHTHYDHEITLTVHIIKEELPGFLDVLPENVHYRIIGETYLSL